MGLDVFFRRDAANFLRATARAMVGPLTLSEELVVNVSAEEEQRLIAAYRAGASDALVSVGLAFGLEPVGAGTQRAPEVTPGLAGLLWAEAPRE